MKIIFITPGTGSYYCGSCLRDVTLVKELRRQGHSAIVVPMYLPFVFEGSDPNSAPLFFGGMNLHLQRLFPIISRTPDWFQRLFDSNVILRTVSQLSAYTSPKKLGELTLETIALNGRNYTHECDRLIQWIKNEGSIDVLCLSNTLLLGLSPHLKKHLNIPVACSLQGEDYFIDNLPSKYAKECWHMLSGLTRNIDLFIPPSAFYADKMAGRLEIARKKMVVVHNGIDMKGFHQSAPQNNRRTIGFLSQLIRSKGIMTLLDAFIELKNKPTMRDVELILAGSLVPGGHRIIREIRAKTATAGYDRSVRIQSNLTRAEKLNFLRQISILSVPVEYEEAFGLYLIEAMAAGVPVVQPNLGAFSEIISLTKGGIVYDPSVKGSYAEALSSLLVNEAMRNKLGQSGQKAVQKSFTVETMARRFLNAVTPVLA